jgi:hypothetical protein
MQVHVFSGNSVAKCMIFGWVLLVEYDDLSREWLPFANVPRDILYRVIRAVGCPDEVRAAGYTALETSQPMFVDESPF